MLKVEKICKTYGDIPVLNDVSFEVDLHEIVCLMGKSGAGKTTILRCINQLESLDKGSIQLGNLKIDSKNKKSPELQRKIGLVFQNWNLFPHWTIMENCIQAPVYHQLMDRSQAIEQAEILLQKMDILNQKDKYPHQLSGGQKQRAAIARACMLNPEILCFDEPTSALDSESTHQVADLIKSLSTSKMGILIVTHDEMLARELNARIIKIE